MTRIIRYIVVSDSCQSFLKSYIKFNLQLVVIHPQFLANLLNSYLHPTTGQWTTGMVKVFIIPILLKMVKKRFTLDLRKENLLSIWKNINDTFRSIVRQRRSLLFISTIQKMYIVFSNANILIPRNNTINDLQKESIKMTVRRNEVCNKSHLF